MISSSERARFDDVNARLAVVIEKLKALYSSSLSELTMSRKAGELWLDYQLDKDTQCLACFKIDELGPNGGYIRRVPANALKLAMLHRISRFAAEELANLTDPVTIEIELDDVEWAIGKMEKSILHYNAMIARWMKMTRTRIQYQMTIQPIRPIH